MKCVTRRGIARDNKSLPLRGAWIEIVCGVPLVDLVNVAPLAGGVD